jgi:hypothetical protein
MKPMLCFIALLTSSAAAWSQPDAHPWWSNHTAALVGGLGGGILGCLGGLIGVLGGMGKCRGLVITLLGIMTCLGIILGVAGIAALARHQPYAVWYPLLMIGILLLVICPFLLPVVRRRYQELELRRMQSLDASG